MFWTEERYDLNFSEIESLWLPFWEEDLKGSDWHVSNRSGKTGYISKVEHKGFMDGSDMGCDKKREGKDDFKILAWAIRSL